MGVSASSPDREAVIDHSSVLAILDTFQGFQASEKDALKKNSIK